MMPKLPPPLENPYQVLHLERGATPEEVKRAYFTLVRQSPPETHPEEFKRIRAAYDRLRTPEKRRETELFLVKLEEQEVDFSLLPSQPPSLDREQIITDLLRLEAERLWERLRADLEV